MSYTAACLSENTRTTFLKFTAAHCSESWVFKDKVIEQAPGDFREEQIHPVDDFNGNIHTAFGLWWDGTVVERVGNRPRGVAGLRTSNSELCSCARRNHGADPKSSLTLKVSRPGIRHQDTDIWSIHSAYLPSTIRVGLWNRSVIVGTSLAMLVLQP